MTASILLSSSLTYQMTANLIILVVFTVSLTSVAAFPLTVICSNQQQRVGGYTPRHMGGYYSEPEEIADSDADGRPQHMIFGVKCFEDSFQLAAAAATEPIKFLEPISEKEKNDINNPGDAFTKSSSVAFAETLVQNLNTNDQNVVLLGSDSIIAMTLARLGGSNVRVYDATPKESHLRILQHTDMFLNPAPSSKLGRCIKSAGVYSPAEDPILLDDTDLIVVTASSLEPFSIVLEEALRSRIPIVLDASAGSDAIGVIDRLVQGSTSSPIGGIETTALQSKHGILFVQYDSTAMPWVK